MYGAVAAPAAGSEIVTGLSATSAWQALASHHVQMGGVDLRALFANDPERGTRFTSEAAGLYLDYSKNRVDAQTMGLLAALARACRLRERVDAMFNGDAVNTTERRAALHTALRAPSGQSLWVDGVDVVADVHMVLDRMTAFSDQIRRGLWLGHTGQPIRNVINIGIGGSDLGPAMAYTALRHYSQRDLNFAFVANVDGAALAEATRCLDAGKTLFIICSKSFHTPETMANAQAARSWCIAQLGDAAAVARHFIAVSANIEAACAFGIAPEQTFPLWDWVGGRYSMASAIGLSTMIAIGADQFRDMLAGMHAMDEHFRQTPVENNMPALMGLLAVWNNNFLGAQTQAVLPYAQDLSRFPAYLQQLTMESNGKHVTHKSVPVGVQTSPIVWGVPGTNGQHSFYQLLHQGTRLVPCDFIGFGRGVPSIAGEEVHDHRQNDLLMANLFAQAEALAFGRTADGLRVEGVEEAFVPYRVCEGNRPSNTVMAHRLTPYTLGALVVLYEHSVFTQAVIWDIDCFDQWGVELGKVLAEGIAAELAVADLDVDESAPLHDSSTNALLRRYRHLRREDK
ncbi:glucose-6-phosphate isomerase [Acidovorax sp. A1169]|uniref:glucose-6-phosphate isomerase n=1 Tax=Acidovorax sp. A1169 TaxID=3059524 RepID=UPI0027379876|nr:glucose-6-phosphate isomerase [Acidovorax sp. A1169]MDP4078958.1 glucose-6-phosphate isomerase [Acidovorax sp. A1169]